MAPSTDLIGPAALAVKILRTKAQRLAREGKPLAALLYGPIGTGKSTVAGIIAAEVAGDVSLNVERVNGKEIDLEFVRGLRSRTRMRPLIGTAHVLWADEFDVMSADAKDLFLTVLDQSPPHFAFIGTSNADLVNDAKMRNARLQSRLHCIEVARPTEEEIASLLLRRHPALSIPIAREIARLCDGCVRSAVIDAENALDVAEAMAA